MNLEREQSSKAAKADRKVWNLKKDLDDEHAQWNARN